MGTSPARPISSPHRAGRTPGRPPRSVVGSWNDAMRETVAALQLSKPSPGNEVPLPNVQIKAKSLPDIFVLKQNSCNLQGVKDHLGKYPDLERTVKAATGADAAG